MLKLKKYFYEFKFCKILPCVFAGVVFVTTAADAAVVARGVPAASSRVAVSRATGARSGSIAAVMDMATPVAEVVAVDIPKVVEEPVIEIDEGPIVENKSNQFSEILSSVDMIQDGGSNSMAELIRQQRAAFSAADNEQAAAASTAAMLSGAVSNACDDAMRGCMQKTCGDDFSKCAGDGDTVWGGKIESCRRSATCTAVEYTAVVNEIKQDRDLNAQLASFSETMTCGVQYNNCIIRECGNGFAKCISKSGESRAIANCKRTADECRAADSGLSNRAMEVAAAVRVQTEKSVAVWEARLYELRDEMSNQCRIMGGMFDSQSMGCLYTVEFMAAGDGGAQTLYASRKVQPGSVYDCTENWFGVDITTFKENAYRMTRERSAASSAMLGAGAGIAAGLVASGDIGRAVDNAKEEKAAGSGAGENAEDNTTGYGGTIDNTDSKDNGNFNVASDAIASGVKNAMGVNYSNTGSISGGDLGLSNRNTPSPLAGSASLNFSPTPSFTPGPASDGGSSGGAGE